VACPVRDCATRVPVQSRRFQATDRYKCAVHGLFISKSTFEYASPHHNLLWDSPADRVLLDGILQHKRESRLGRERSEDAVSWNVFRYLELSGLLDAWVASVTGQPESNSRVHYWSFDSQAGVTWAPLARARQAFGELEGRGSEPDLIITTDDAHIWVEAKLGSTNSTTPSDPVGARERYVAGGGAWFARTVAADFDVVAIDRRRYELLRLWLLGSWAAEQEGRRFVLVNLVRDGLEEDVPSFAAEHFKLSERRAVRRATWESIYAELVASQQRSADDEKLLAYMRGKTLGYDAGGRLRRAFSND